MPKTHVKAGKSFRAGHVSLSIEAKSSGYDPSISTKVSMDLTLDDARVLHETLGQSIAAAAAKLKAKQDADERRRVWRDREIAAGRMMVMSSSEFFKR